MAETPQINHLKSFLAECEVPEFPDFDEETVKFSSYWTLDNAKMQEWLSAVCDVAEGALGMIPFDSEEGWKEGIATLTRAMCESSRTVKDDTEAFADFQFRLAVELFRRYMVKRSLPGKEMSTPAAVETIRGQTGIAAGDQGPAGNRAEGLPEWSAIDG